MSTLTKNFIKLSVLMAILPCGAFGVQATNPRLSASNNSGRAAQQEVDSNTSLKRSASNVIARSTAASPRQQKQAVVSSRAKLSRAGAVRSPRAVSGNTVSSVKVSRAAAIPASVKPSANSARSALGPNKVMKKTAGVSRAKPSLSRATAVFSDISKIGGGYASCRDSYATCMDQFCAGANETYRRCFCSDKFTDFADTADALDSALQMLAQFQDNNLNAVDKTAAEVSAMYSASAGEAAIKRDTSASQELLNSISDVLAGKKKTKSKSSSSSSNSSNSGSSIGVLDLSSFSVSSGFDDVWGGGSSSGGLFSNNKRSDMEDMSEKEGKELFNSANSQCSEITRDACTSDAMFNLARSAYTVMITQDCNMYEKNLNAKKETVKETVRTAEKYLREARLEEYRKHNSADINECLTKVEEAMAQPYACGDKYINCLDPTGLYINPDTGKPIYSQALFGLNSLIVLDGTADVLGANKSFDNTLDSKKPFVQTALDSCRDISEQVWFEYKRSAIIRIAQAQDDKIQDVKDSCVQTIKECYDKQSGDLAELDDTESQSTGALQAVAARGMCYERVQACAALYGDPDGCKYDDKTKKLTTNGNKKCGLQALLSYVDTVDSVKVAEGCEDSLTKYLAKLCPDTTAYEDEIDPETGELTGSKKAVTVKYGECAKDSRNDAKNEWNNREDELRAALESHINTFCATDAINQDESNTISTGKAYNMNVMNKLIKELFDSLGLAFTTGCTADGKGQWIDHPADYEYPDVSLLRQDFYQMYYGATVKTDDQIKGFNMMKIGYCYDKALVEDFESLREVCTTFGGKAKSATKGPDGSKPAMCELPESFYKTRCCQLGGTYTNAQCVIDDWPNSTKTDCGTLF